MNTGIPRIKEEKRKWIHKLTCICEEGRERVMGKGQREKREKTGQGPAAYPNLLSHGECTVVRNKVRGKKMHIITTGAGVGRRGE